MHHMACSIMLAKTPASRKGLYTLFSLMRHKADRLT